MPASARSARTLPVQAFVDAFDVDFVGVVNTVHAALPHLT